MFQQLLRHDRRVPPDFGPLRQVASAGGALQHHKRHRQP